MPRNTRTPLGAAGAVALTALVAAGSSIAAAPAFTADTTPKNVIVLIGDGMGYNTLDLANSFDTGDTYYQVTTGPDRKVIPAGSNAARPTDGYQSWNLVGQSTYWADGNVYDPSASWGDFEWNKGNPTDSAAAGTAMATGVKTYNAGIGVDVNEQIVENVSERAAALGKSAGVVSSVPFSHATPAAYSSHNTSRNDYHGIAAEQLSGKMDVVIGAGHPFYDDDHQPLATPNYQYIGQPQWEQLSTGASPYTFVETKADFEALTTGNTPEKFFGVPQVASTLQQGRAAGAANNDVPNLATLAKGALNVLDNNDEGLFLMVEGGAIDWTGHSNQTDRSVEETQDFNKAVDSVIDWVDTNSNWDETLVIVTADHETGYISGPEAGTFNPLGDAPAGDYAPLSWNSTNHTNQLVPFFFRGAGSDELLALADQRDLVRGHYIDNTETAAWLLNTAWVAEEEPEPTGTETSTAEPTTAPTTDPTTSETPAGSPTTSQPAEAGGSNGSSGSGGNLASTGAEGIPVVVLTALVLGAIGTGAVLIARRRGVRD